MQAVPEQSQEIQALKKSETQTRVKTGLAAGALFLALLIGGGFIGAAVLATILAGVMCYELSKIFYTLPDRLEKMIALQGTAWLVLVSNTLFPHVFTETFLMGFLGLFTYFLASAERHPDRLREHFSELIATVFALFYIVGPLTFLPALRGSSHGIAWTMLFLCMVWACDTGAYFAGRKWGKTKLYPLISPGKSVQGSIAGLLSAVVISFLFKLLFLQNISWFGAVLIPLVIGTLSQVGDLCESFFKRAFGIKDTGQILPGHGGMLDRFDSIIFTLPIMYYLTKLFS